MASPHVVDFDDEELNAVLVACGSRHTIVFFGKSKYLFVYLFVYLLFVYLLKLKYVY